LASMPRSGMPEVRDIEGLVANEVTEIEAALA